MNELSKWIYTATGELTPKKVEIRHQVFRNIVWLNNPRDTVLRLVVVKEPASTLWPERSRPSVVMIGLGQQRKRDFHVIQYASDWERDLLDAARPMLGLAERILVESRYNEEGFILAGSWVNSHAPIWPHPPLWPSVNIRSKVLNVRTMLQAQGVDPLQVDRTGDISDKEASRHWKNASKRESVWRHNFFDVVETSMKIFQLQEF